MCCRSRRGLGVPLGAMEVPEPICVQGRWGYADRARVNYS
jgi:hypothetical protein